MIRDIILVQKREKERKLEEDYVERNAALKGIKSGLINVIIGPRRAGKSFFALHTLNRTADFGYANFDDERLVKMKDYDELVGAIDSVYDNPKYLLLDEIQNLDGWELFINRLQRQGYKIVLTGSNSRLLSRELATHLTGRHAQVTIFPFSFEEFLKLEKKELTESETKSRLHTYLTSGGYPETHIKNLDHRDYLSTLFNSILYKDIVRRFKIRSVKGMEDLATYLISNTAREFSYNTLSKVTGGMSVHTIEKYLGYLEEAFLLFKLSRFSNKVREQISFNKKIYCTDCGLISAKAFKLSPDTGRLYENIVAIELKKMELNGDASIYFWRSSQQEEVDFVIKRGLKIRQLIQVCYNLDDLKTKEREIRSLIKAKKELGCGNLLVITEDHEGEEQVSWYGNKAKIRFIPLFKWLCGVNRDTPTILYHPQK